MIQQSEHFNPNYAAKICRIDAIEPIAGANRLVHAVLGNDKIIISNDIKVGDIVIFFPCETVICDEYLSHHNLYEDFTKNSNADIYQSFLDKIEILQGDIDHDYSTEIAQYLSHLKTMKGFFKKSGRVRMLKLMGEYSLGFVVPVQTLEEVWPSLEQMDWSKHLNEQFDMIDDKVICWKYVPPCKPVKTPEPQRSVALGFDRLIPGQFHFHYGTGWLADNLQYFNPWDEIDITIKVHGTSVVISNVLVNRQLSLWEKIKKFFTGPIAPREYGIIYSSRRVIKNRYVNSSDFNHPDSEDIHGCVARDFAQFLSPGMTVYGEIVGYFEGTDKLIQKDHDYGCQPGHWKFMPYRITQTNQYGDVVEWEVDRVMKWTSDLIWRCDGQHQELVDKILPMQLLYHGRAGDMYDNLYARVAVGLSEAEYESEKRRYPSDELPWYLQTPENYVIHHWRTAWLDTMRNDTTFLGLEKREPMCKNKVPREGVVIRKCRDKQAEAFKLKSAAHYHLEMMQHDAGETDIEEES